MFIALNGSKSMTAFLAHNAELFKNMKTIYILKSSSEILTYDLGAYKCGFGQKTRYF